MRTLLLISIVLVAGCDQIRSSLEGPAAVPETEIVAGEEAPPQATEVAAAPRDQIDPGWTGARQTVAGLGDPTIPGPWLETPLVTQERPGRVVMRKTGASAVVTLIPSGGEVGSGSRLSLAAMRALLAPIDQLIELDVYSTS